MATPSKKIVYVIFRDPVTGYFGYKVRFEDRESFHRVFDTSMSLQSALDSCDAQRERIWIEPESPSDDALLVSHEYREGTVGWRMEQYEPHIVKRPFR